MASPLVPWSSRALGTEVRADGVGFAVFAGHATSVTLVTLHDDGRECRHGLHAGQNGIWSGFLQGAAPALRYGFFVDGPTDRHQGHAHHAGRRLVDPRARSFEGEFDALPHLRSPTHNDARPWSVVTDDRLDAGRAVAKRPHIPWRDTVIYEAHVRALTKRHPAISREIQGTYAALAHPAMLAHYKALGVTTLELLPVCESATEAHLVKSGLTNYWGYAPIGYFAASRHYARHPGRANDEFRSAIDALHEAGFEVVLDVVFNHTGEGGEDANGEGITWHFRGLDRRTYYRTQKGKPETLVDFSGCGNTLDLDHPRVIEFVLDALRYWAGPMGVDGFRFDLAATMARSHGKFGHESKLLAAIRHDPLLGPLKLIAEPWDLGPEGYRLGQFQQPFREWNDRFRDSVRAFWTGEPSALGDFATRLAGSADIFNGERGGQTASINYVTAHDGFTLADLVAYDRKHNEDNGENSRDGSDANRSWNGGEEGPSRNPEVRAERRRRMKSMLATLLLSGGTPMLSHGDERARTQMGNNNAYCHDGPLTWIDWTHIADHGRDLVGWIGSLVKLRMQYACFRPTAPLRDHGAKGGDVGWYGPDGHPMTGASWRELGPSFTWVSLEHEPEARAFAFLANGLREAKVFRLPRPPHGGRGWSVLLDGADRFPPAYRLEGGDSMVLPSGAVLIATET